MHDSGSFGTDNLPPHFDFALTSAAPVTQSFLAHGARKFSDALRLIAHLPYGRNAAKDDLLCPLREGRGTCSTKHALLKSLADEHSATDVRLMMGIYRMKEGNTPRVGRVLEAAGMAYLPEAHVYLRIGGAVVDCMTAKSWPAVFIADLLEEEEIAPAQIGEWKVARHRTFLDSWRDENFSGPLEELWQIRERCIAALSGL